MSAYRDQHFLTDLYAVERIATVLDVSGRNVLEIGPGRGVLTRALLEHKARVIAVEVDQTRSLHMEESLQSIMRWMQILQQKLQERSSKS